MLNQQQLAALSFAISRARAFAPADATQVALDGIRQAEEVLQLLQQRIAAGIDADTKALEAIDRARSYIKAGHPHGPAATIDELDAAEQLIVTRKGPQP